MSIGIQEVQPDFRWPPPEATVPQLIDSVAARAPEREAVVTDGERLTYAALAARSQAAARALASIGVGEDSLVAFMAPNLAEWVPTTVGAML